MAQAGTVPSTDGWVERPADVDRVVSALTSGVSGLIMVVPEVEGVEGLGVTAVVAAALRRPEVARRFPDGVGWVSAGGHPETWADELTQVLQRLHGEKVEPYTWLSTFDFADFMHDEEAVGGFLEEEIFKPAPRLVVIDGLRHAGMVLPLAFTVPDCTWLVTAGVADERLRFAATVPVGPMTGQDGAALLRRDLPGLAEGTAALLAELTGGWPLALTMAHGVIISQVVTGAPATEAAAGLAARLPGPVDLASPASRAALIGAVVDHSLDWLRTVDPIAAERFLQLGLFGANEAIPIGVAALLWSSGGDVTGGQIGALIARLEGLSLVSRRTDYPVLLLPVAVGERVRELLGTVGLERARRALVEADPEETPEGWAQLPGTGKWMLRNLAELHADLGEGERLADLVCDVTWLSARIQQSGVHAALDDLAKAGGGSAESFWRVLGGSYHLFETASELGLHVMPTLAARLRVLPGEEERAREQLADRGESRLEPRWTPPDLAHPALVRTHHGRCGEMNGLAMTPDGAWLAAAGDQSRVVRRRADGARIDALLGHEASVRSVAVAPDASWLATASWDGTVRLWEQDGRPLAVLDDLPDLPETVAIAPDGTWLVAGGDGFLRFWNADGTARADVAETWENYEAIAIAPDGAWLVTASEDVTELRNADGTLRATVRAADDEDDEGVGADAVAIAPSGEWLAVLDPHGDIRLVNSDGSPRALLDGVRCAGRGLAIAPDGSWLATSDWDGDVVIMDLDGSVRARLRGHTEWVAGLAVTSDGRRLASAGGDGTVRVWDVDVALSQGPSTPPARQNSDGLAVAGDGSCLATVGRDGLTLWEADGDLRGSGPGDYMGSVAIAPDGAFVLTADCEGRIRLHEPDGSVRRTEQVHSTRIMAAAPSAAIAPDGTWMAVAMNDGVRILNTHGEGTTAVGPFGADVSAVAIAPDSASLVVASGLDVRLRNAKGRPLGRWARARSTIHALAVSPDGRHLAVGGAEGVVELFDERGERVAMFGQDDRLTGVAFSPDGDRLATTAMNGCLRVWDIATRTTEAAIVVDGELRGCAWFPDGSGVCAAGAAGLFGFTYRR
ncbi:hypothetical protein AB0I81_02185 [Nonomuraea sp. NPDC050404]|uniref:hypothetical protein n=1 Tax=Nonomuraea sp. NPDC050404 TaxID=3155783 RepID=UPI0033DE20F8